MYRATIVGGIGSVITMELIYPRMIHAEIMTYRKEVARNAASSRAMPFQRVLGEVRTFPAKPAKWISEKPGMSGGEELIGNTARDANLAWMAAARDAAKHAEALSQLGVHHSQCNRLLEPFMFMHTLFSASMDAWMYIVQQRRAADADVTIQPLAHLIFNALINRPAEIGIHQWSLPYIMESDSEDLGFHEAALVSVARCARVSYTPFGHSKPNLQKDLALAKRLWKDGHLSPFEHVYTTGTASRGASAPAPTPNHTTSHVTGPFTAHGITTLREILRHDYELTLNREATMQRWLDGQLNRPGRSAP